MFDNMQISKNYFKSLFTGKKLNPELYNNNNNRRNTEKYMSLNIMEKIHMK